MKRKPGLGERAGLALAPRRPEQERRPGGFVSELARQHPTDFQVPTDGRLADNPTNPRDDLGDLEGLAASIRSRGLLQPIAVAPAEAFRQENPDTPLPDSAEWVIIAGHRRRAAAVLAGVETLPAYVRDRGTAAADRLTDALVENCLREGLTPLAEARALAEVRDTLGLSQRQLSDRTGISQGQISKRLTLLEMPAQVQDAIDDGAVQVQDVQHLRRLDEVAQVVAVTTAAATGVPVATVVRQLERDPAFAPNAPDSTESPKHASEQANSHAVEQAESDEWEEAAAARAEACRHLASTGLKSTDATALLVDVVLDPPRARHAASIRTAAAWLDMPITGRPDQWAAGVAAAGGRRAVKLAVAVALARREADAAAQSGAWSGAGRRHVRMLVASGAHSLYPCEAQELGGRP